MNWRRFTVAIFVVLLTTALFIPVVSGQSADTASGSNTADRTQSAPIDPELQTAAGTTEVVVRLAGMDGPQIAAQSDPVASLHSQADQTQQPVVEYAQQHDGINIKDRFWITNAVLLEVDTSRVSLDRIATIEGVKRIHANFQVELAATSGTSTGTNTSAGSLGSTVSGTTASEYTYGLEQMNVPDVWQEFDTSGSGATVAVLDTGVDAANHSDLAPIDGGWKDFINNRPNPYDDLGHGTHVTGTVVGNQTPTGTHYGVAPTAELLHGKVFDSDGNSRFSYIIEALEWSVAHEANIDVVSMSLGAGGYQSQLIDPIQNANAADIIVVAAVGNDGSGTSISPGNYYSTLNVGATTDTESIASFSGGEKITTADAWGDEAPSSWPDSYIVPSVVAPGDSVLSAVPGGGYAELDGTSMATPHIAGTIALMQAATDNQLTPSEIKATLTETAWKPDSESTSRNTRYGDGIADAYAAVNSVTATDEPAELTLETAMLDTDRIVEGESVTTTLTIQNSGGTTGTFTANLSSNGTVSQTGSVDVPPKSSAQLSFVSTFDTAGNYTIAINNQTIDIVTVQTPARFELGTLELDPTVVPRGTSTEATVSVTNTGDVAGTQDIVIMVANDTGLIDQLTKTQSVTLAGASTTSISFDTDTEVLVPGSYNTTIASANDSANASLTVGAPQQLTATRTITDRTVSAGETTTVTLSVTGNQAFDSLQVSESISPSPTQISVVTDSGAAASRIQETDDQLRVAWENTNTATVTYELTAPDSAADGTHLRFAGTATTGNNLTVPIDGDDRLSIDKAATTYTDETGRIGSSGFIDAAIDFQTGRIGAEVFTDVAIAFETGDPITTTRQLSTYAGSDGRIGSAGYIDAAIDFQTGVINPELYTDVAIAFETGDPVVASSTENG